MNLKETIGQINQRTRESLMKVWEESEAMQAECHSAEEFADKYTSVEIHEIDEGEVDEPE